MVRERKLIFDMKELEGVVFRCVTCKQEVMHRLDTSSKLQPHCPFCHEEWVDQFPGKGKVNQEETLLNVLRHFYISKKDSPVTVRLRLDDTSVEDGKTK